MLQKFFHYIVEENRAIVKDMGVMLFFLVLPIAYPLIYSWIYNNEVVREVPVVLIDNSHSSLSREFARKFDASPDVAIAYHCGNIKQAEQIIADGKAYGILVFPSDFDKKIGRMEQSTVSVYCDMSYMLTYKAIFQTATAISMEMGNEVKKHLLGNKTAREDEISLSPLTFDEVPLFNVTGGYGNFILLGVLPLIIQQAMLLGIGMISGTEKEEKYKRYRYSSGNAMTTAIAKLCAKVVVYIAIFSVMLAWVLLVIPHLFGFISLVHAKDLLLFMTPYLLACSFFAITASELVHYRESVMLVIVFSSIPLLFMAGVSWPLSSIPGTWQGVSHIFPSTFCIRGFVRMSSMGALIGDVLPEYQALWRLTVIYAFTALFTMWRRVKFAEPGKNKEVK